MSPDRANHGAPCPTKQEAKEANAGVAQLVEHYLAKVDVASSSLVTRSNPDKYRV